MYRRKPSLNPIVDRWEGNPLITIEDLDFQCSDLRSPGIAFYRNEIILLITIEDLSGSQSIHLARKTTNRFFHVEEKAFLKPSNKQPYKRHEMRGVLDPRVTFLEGRYYITYVAYGDHGYRLALAQTTDFVNVERIGFISEPDTKAGAIFSKKIHGRYAILKRPRESNSIWISYSDDLIYWGASELVLPPRGGFWDSSRVGCGPPPISIERGWLLMYYGVKETNSGPLYRIGAAILDKKNPTEVIARGNIPVLSPREHYERIGDVQNLIFSAGAFVDKDGGIDIYYSAANSAICIAHTTIDRIVNECIESKEAF